MVGMPPTPSIDTELARALALRDAGATGEALSVCMQVAKAASTDARPLRLAGHILFGSGRLDEAILAFEAALARAPGPTLRAELGAVLLAAGRAEDALPHLRRAHTEAPDQAVVVGRLGLALRALKQFPEAVAHLSRAAALAPRVADHHAHLAATLESLGRNDEAAAAADRALDVAPKHTLALLVRAQLQRVAGDPAGALARLEGLLEAPLSARDRSEVQHERGQALDRLGRTEEAFAAFSESKSLAGGLPAARTVDRAHYPALLRVLAGHYRTAGAPRPGPSDPGTPRIGFLVGFPRSGTTLMEQVLGAHPVVKAIDEQEVLADTLRACPTTIRRPLGYPAGMDSLTDAEIALLQADYRSRMTQVLGAQAVSGADLVLDKMPLNLPHLGWIRRLFPDAPVLVMLRDPRDCVLSSFMQNFDATTAMVQTETLLGAAQMYAQVMGIWLLAREWPSLRAIEIRYEDVVENLEVQSRRAVAHLGLPWDGGVLAWREGISGRHISTPSRQDVAKPIFTRARGRWRRYEAQLAQVQPILAPFVRAFGYDE